MLAIKYLVYPTKPFYFLSSSNKRYLLSYVESHIQFAESTNRCRDYILGLIRRRLGLTKRLLILAKDKKFIDGLLSKIDTKYPSKMLYGETPYRETPLFVIFYRRLRIYLYYAFIFFLFYYIPAKISQIKAKIRGTK